MTEACGNNQEVHRQVLMLTMTEECNLSCIYCYEKNKDTSRMEVRVAKEAIEQAFEGQGDELEIDFHGGEPLIAFPQIKEISEWVWGKPRPKPYILFVTTNGTMAHGQIQDWAKRHKERLVMGVSLDGTPDMHNSNRSNSFNRIDIDFFKDTWPFQPAKMTISQQSLGSLADGVIYLHNRGIKFTANTAHGITWESDSYDIFASEMHKLANFYIAHPDIEPVDLIALPLEHLARPIGQENHRWCGAGTKLNCLGMDGTLYPCHTFMPSSQEDGTAQKTLEAFKALKGASAEILDPKCNGCVISQLCPTCYGLNLAETGDLIKRSDSTCAFTKIRSVSSAYMVAHMLKDKEKYVYLRNYSDADILARAQGSQIVFRDVDLSPEALTKPVYPKLSL